MTEVPPIRNTTILKPTEECEETELVAVPGIRKEILLSFKQEAPVGYALFKAVVEAGDVHSNPNRLEQLKVFLHLPKHFLRQLAQHLEMTEQRQELFQKKSSRVNAAMRNTFTGFTGEKKQSILAGEFFEELVRTEHKMYELESVSDQPELEQQVLERLKLARELMQIWQYPERYGIRTHWRNPDAAFFEVQDDGRILVKAVGEVKTGNLDTRAFQQLQESGIQSQLLKVISYLQEQNASWFAQYNLEHLASAISKIDIAKDFIIRLIIPRNREVTKEGITYKEACKLIKKLEKNKNVVGGDPRFGTITVEEFARMLMNKDRILVKKSLFSQKELRAMITILYGYIET